MEVKESCINWYGGKGGNHQKKLLKKILNYINTSNNKKFIDVFGGSGIVTINVKNKIRKYNDINRGLYNFFVVLKDKDLSEEIIKILELTLYDEENYIKIRDEILLGKEFEVKNIDMAVSFYIATMQSYSSLGSMMKSGFRTSNKIVRNGMSQAVSSWKTNVDINLINTIEEFRECEVYNYDFLDCINKFDSENAIFYLDPPYIPDTRKSKEVYLNELSNDRHEELVDKLLKIKGKAILSGYDHIIYKPLEENGWKKEEIKKK